MPPAQRIGAQCLRHQAHAVCCQQQGQGSPLSLPKCHTPPAQPCNVAGTMASWLIASTRLHSTHGLHPGLEAQASDSKATLYYHPTDTKRQGRLHYLWPSNHLSLFQIS